MTENPSYQKYHDGLVADLERDLVSNPTYRLSYAVSNDHHIRTLVKQMGVYILYFGGVVIYVGRSVKEVIERLRKHWKKFRALDFIEDLDDIQCQFIILPTPAMVLAAEDILIKKFKPILNGTDFGNNSYLIVDSQEYQERRRYWRPVLKKFVEDLEVAKKGV